MSSVMSSAPEDLRARVLHVLRGFKEYFSATQFRKAYKSRYAEKFSSGSVTTREYLKTFPELSFYEEEDQFSLNNKKVKIEEESSSSDDDDDDEDASEVEEETNETVTDDMETWYDKTEFQETLKAVKKELKANPDPSISEDDIRLFAKLHLLREMCIKVIVKVVQKPSDGPPFFFLSDFSREWNSSQKVPTIPCEQLGLTLCGFLKSFLQLRKLGFLRFAISSEQDGADDSSKTKSVARRIIDDGKKELMRQQDEKKKSDALLTEDAKREERAVRQKVLAMATRISQHSPVHGLHFRISDFSLQWKHVYGEKPVPCAQFGFTCLSSYLASIPELRRIARKMFAVRSPSQSKSVAESINEEPSSKRVGGRATEESTVDDNGERETALRRKVLAMAQRLATYDSAGELHFDAKKLLHKWRRTEPNFIPHEELGFKNIHAFLKSFPELKNRRHSMYMFRSSQPLGNDADGSKDLGERKKTSGDDEKESDESESDDSDEEEEELSQSGDKDKRSADSSSESSRLKEKTVEHRPTAAKLSLAAVVSSESSSEEESESDDSDEEEEELRRKKAMAAKKCSPKALPTGQKTVLHKKYGNEVLKGGKKATSEVVDSEDSSSGEEETCHQKKTISKILTKRVCNSTISDNSEEEESDGEALDANEKNIRRYLKFLKTKKPARYDSDAIEKRVKLDFLKKQVIQMVRTVIEPSPKGPIFSLNRFVREWRRRHGERLLPCAQFGYRSLNGFFESFTEFQRMDQDTYLFVDPLSQSGEKDKRSADSSSESSRLKERENTVERRPTAAKVSIATDDSSEEDESEREKKKTEKKKTLTVVQEIQTGQKTAQKLQKKTGKNTRGVFSSSDSDSDDEEATAVKNIRKRENQSKVVREMGAQPKMNIKEKEKAEEEPKKKKALKKSRSPVVIVLDDDEPSPKVPKVEIQEIKETHLVGEEDQKAMSSSAPMNQMDQSAPGFPMSGAPPPLFAQHQLNLTKGGVAALFMAQLLDSAESKGLDVDAIAMEAVNLIKEKTKTEKKK